MSNCPRSGKWVRSCYFEPRYDLSPAQLPDSTGRGVTAVGPVLERFRQKTYVRDVCIRCGATIERLRP